MVPLPALVAAWMVLSSRDLDQAIDLTLLFHIFLVSNLLEINPFDVAYTAQLMRFLFFPSNNLVNFFPNSIIPKHLISIH